MMTWYMNTNNTQLHTPCDNLREKFGGTTVSKLTQLTIKFDIYKKVLNKSMKQNLRDILDMIIKLKLTRHNLKDEQQVQVVIQSLPDNWEHMKVNMTYNENTKTFLNIAHHIKSEDDRFKAIKPGANAYVLEFSSKRFFGFKLK